VHCFNFHELQKRELESILSVVGVEVEHEEILCRDQDKGLYEMGRRKGTCEIIELYGSEALLMIFWKLSRGIRTVSEHVKKHNQVVGRSGFFATCKRIGSEIFDRQVVREEDVLNICG